MVGARARLVGRSILPRAGGVWAPQVLSAETRNGKVQ
jgi:hypothetical protein